MTRPDGVNVELLAALDAGLLDPAQEQAVRDAGDPAALAVFAALAATRSQLAALPVLTVPSEVAGRWTAALRTDSAAPCPPHRRTLGACRPLRRTARPLASAAALVAVVTGVWFTRPAPPDVVGFDRVDLLAVGTAAVGVLDLGELADADRRAACLHTVDAPGAQVLGGRRVLMDGRPGTLLVLGAGELGRFRLVVVDPSCTSVLAEAVVGHR